MRAVHFTTGDSNTNLPFFTIPPAKNPLLKLPKTNWRNRGYSMVPSSHPLLNSSVFIGQKTITRIITGKTPKITNRIGSVRGGMHSSQNIGTLPLRKNILPSQKKRQNND